MKKFLLSLLLVVIIGLSAIFIARFLFGGDEDTWICVNNQWVKHGNPKASMPQVGCSEAKSNWQKITVDEIGLSFEAPTDTIFRKEIADDAGRIHTLGFYVEKEDKNNSSYTLYGVYQAYKKATEQDLEKTRTDMDKGSIKEVTVDGYKGIEGLILGPKTRYITIILKNDRILSISTIPPTKDNKTLTDQILSTFSFK